VIVARRKNVEALSTRILEAAPFTKGNQAASDDHRPIQTDLVSR